MHTSAYIDCGLEMATPESNLCDGWPVITVESWTSTHWLGEFSESRLATSSSSSSPKTIAATGTPVVRAEWALETFDVWLDLVAVCRRVGLGLASRPPAAIDELFSLPDEVLYTSSDEQLASVGVGTLWHITDNSMNWNYSRLRKKTVAWYIARHAYVFNVHFVEHFAVSKPCGQRYSVFIRDYVRPLYTSSAITLFIATARSASCAVQPPLWRCVEWCHLMTAVKNVLPAQALAVLSLNEVHVYKNCRNERVVAPALLTIRHGRRKKTAEIYMLCRFTNHVTSARLGTECEEECTGGSRPFSVSNDGVKMRSSKHSLMRSIDVLTMYMAFQTSLWACDVDATTHATWVTTSTSHPCHFTYQSSAMAS